MQQELQKLEVVIVIYIKLGLGGLRKGGLVKRSQITRCYPLEVVPEVLVGFQIFQACLFQVLKVLVTGNNEL